MSDITHLYRRLKESKKYKDVCDDTISRISQWALDRFKEKEAEKAAKKKLHQVYGAYFEKMKPAKILERLDGLPADPDNDSLRSIALEIMKSHASSSERLPIMERFYTELFMRTGKPKKILDIACGLNPFSIPWMNLEPGTEYLAFDIDKQLISILGIFFKHLSSTYRAELADVLVSPPKIEADMVFLFKTLPCLEQQEKGISEALLKSLRAKYIVISFPSRSLSGKSKGMAVHYDEFATGLINRLGLHYFKMEYPNELFYVCTS